MVPEDASVIGRGRFPSVSNDGTLVYVDGAESSQQLIWVDRRGARLGAIGQPQDGIFMPAISPDGAQVAVNGVEGDNGDIWVHQLDRPIKARVTFDPGRDRRPVWSPTGDRIAFDSAREGPGGIYAKPASGAGNAEKLFSNQDRQDQLEDWSADGRHIVVRIQNASDLSFDLWRLEQTDSGDWEPHPYLATNAAERIAVFSPNDRYVAYVSDESGRDEIYVRPFPNAERKWQVSENGGTQPRWVGDEVFYVATDTLYAARVSVNEDFRVLSTERLFRDQRLFFQYPLQKYDVASDGQRFILIDSVSEEASTIHVVQNWDEEFGQQQD